MSLTLPAEHTPSAGTALSAVPLLQTAAVLLLIVVLLVLAGWLIKKQRELQSRTYGPLNITASLSVGQREKIVLLALPDCQLLLGITAQQITHLHTLPAAETTPEAPNGSAAGTPFADRLRALLEKRALHK